MILLWVLSCSHAGRFHDESMTEKEMATSHLHSMNESFLNDDPTWVREGISALYHSIKGMSGDADYSGSFEGTGTGKD